MKLLYFPGIQSLIERNFDMATSTKLVHLMKICDCGIYDYHSYDPTGAVNLAQKYDILFGSSFGGYFAFYIANLTGQTCIMVNPSLYLDKRIEMLFSKHPHELGFMKPAVIAALKSEPVKSVNSNIHVLMNMDDEVLDAQKVLEVAEKYGCSTYTFPKGGHESSNFIGEMLPLIKQIINSNA